ncbi:SAM-dependent methyltransferase [Cylindrospermum sp. FACHB-282]|uniref:SAM-dependent methyltransferase n=1 Tax=Cylindrospermum sp. FACHB-282 TaxID=2692794 RepID=UPI001686E044|nr:SAM-dependent methyltransferase [Cylindrospermum sp. FACHB-282]MBD2387115.1 SAM-dependent methyltransferase [Cylindrospermum sp. FACHB-282]
MSEATETSVSFTAKVMAAGRAIETQRPDALFTDPLAAQLAGQEAIEAAIPTLEEYEKQGRPFTSVRTRFFDDFLNKYSDNIRQIVLLGSGMDTRAFRLNWPPGTHVYEIDQPDVMLYKESVLNGVIPNCTRHSICADLKESFWSQLLLKEGYQTSEPTIWLLEGFLYYLNPIEAKNLLRDIQNLSAKGSYFGADVINTVICNGSDEWAKYWQFSCDEPESFFAAYDWKVSAIQPGEEGASFGRFTYQFPARNIPDVPHIFFVLGVKED